MINIKTGGIKRMQRMIEICNILLQYINPRIEPYSFWSEHDVIGFIVDPSLISQTDMKRLEELGVLYSEMYDSLIIFT